MDFKNKDLVMGMIRRGQTQQKEIESLRTRLLQTAEVLDRVKGTNLAQTLAQEYAGGAAAGGTGAGKHREEKASAMERSRRSTREAVRPR